ncbi:hypothetical protein COCON_G00179600 [Conger conger]|uniref:CP-type G domain-containing protein n=1 Tax=Conger conger TaxID=82655 RepID=A0A9Q1D5I8_CONCO|nr:hypothetical protein COCON_G00179600 [Conger conger]
MVRRPLRHPVKDGRTQKESQEGRKNTGHASLFKEAGQREAELRKQRLENLQEKQKASRERERQSEFEKKENEMQNLEKHVNFENENSRKAYYREFKKVIERADVILEVLDARDPLGCRCPQVEQAVVQSGTNKKIVLVLNKIDLVSKEIVEKWIKYLRNEFPTVAFKASTQQQNRNLKRSSVPITQASSELLGSSACVGADLLMKLLGNYCRNLNIKTTITVGVVGFPNVGKSSLINSLKRARACSVGATPGVTRHLQEVHLDKHIKLLDCPGIVMATSTSDAGMILRNCMKIEQLVDPMEPVAAILRRCNRNEQGKLKKGGLPDHDKAAKSVLQDWTGGRISYFTHPPETHTLPTHVSAEIVAEMGKAFDLDELEKGNQEALAEVNCADVPMGLCMASSGMTQGGELEMEGEAVTLLQPEDAAESMDQDQDTEFGPMTVEIRGVQAKSGGPADVPARAPDLRDILHVDPLQQGQALLAAGKKRKKQQKRADKIATKLSDTLTSAMNFSLLDS